MRTATCLLWFASAAFAADTKTSSPSQKGKPAKPAANKGEVVVPVDDHGSVVRMKGTRFPATTKTGSHGRVSFSFGIEGKKDGPVTDVAGFMAFQHAVVDRDESQKQGFRGDSLSGVRVSADGARVEFRGKSSRLNWSNLALRPTGGGPPMVTITLTTRHAKGGSTYRITKNGLVEVK